MGCLADHDSSYYSADGNNSGHVTDEVDSTPTEAEKPAPKGRDFYKAKSLAVPTEEKNAFKRSKTTPGGGYLISLIVI